MCNAFGLSAYPRSLRLNVTIFVFLRLVIGTHFQKFGKTLLGRSISILIQNSEPVLPVGLCGQRTTQ